MSIGITSVDGDACFGIYAEARLADDANHLAHEINRAVSELLAAIQRPARADHEPRRRRRTRPRVYRHPS